MNSVDFHDPLVVLPSIIIAMSSCMLAQLVSGMNGQLQR
jgi:hypothetical protein